MQVDRVTCVCLPNMSSMRVSVCRPAIRYRPASAADLTQTETSMSALRSLTFTTVPKIGANPALDRRTNIIARLEEQKLLLNDPNYTRTVRTWVKKDGQLMPVDKPQRILPWWRVNADGPMSSLFGQVRNRLSSRRARTQSPFRRSTRSPWSSTC